MQSFSKYSYLDGRQGFQAIFLKPAEIFSVRLQEILLKNFHYYFGDGFSNFSKILCVAKNIYCLQGCGNISSKIFCPRSEYFEKLSRKVSATFCVIFQVS